MDVFPNPECRYETKSLATLYGLTRKHTYDDGTPEFRALCSLQRKAQNAAKECDQIFTNLFLKDYLNDDVKIGVLVDISTKCSRGSDAFSRSHSEWIDKLRLLKLKWTWDEPGIQRIKLAELEDEFVKLQKMAYSFKP